MINGLKIGYIGGGSMNWAWAVMGDLALEPELSGEVRLYDIDFNSAKSNEAIGNQLNNHPKTQSKWSYKACPNMEEALIGADFVIVSILPGTFDEMESDVHTPEAYGIYQSVGDTTGPAGVVRAMRTVPMIEEIGLAIRDYCPNAWVINYTNPMAICVNTMYKVFPGIKAIGCCHEAFHLQALLAKAYEHETGIVIDKSDIGANYLGVNHFVWANRANYKNTNLMPLFAKLAQKYSTEGYGLRDSDNDANNIGRNLNKVCFDLFNRYGAIPVAGDRHLAEFMPPWYLADRETTGKWGFGLTPVPWRKKNHENRIAKRARILTGEEDFAPENSGEEGTQLIKALLGLSDMMTTVNLPNTGQMADIGYGIVVETNALVTRDAIYPVCAGKLPDMAHMMVSKHASQQEMLMKACMDRDLGLAFSVFVEDNLVNLSLNDATELFRKMINNTKEYLDGWCVKDF